MSNRTKKLSDFTGVDAKTIDKSLSLAAIDHFDTIRAKKRLMKFPDEVDAGVILYGSFFTLATQSSLACATTVLLGATMLSGTHRARKFSQEFEEAVQHGAREQLAGTLLKVSERKKIEEHNSPVF